MNPKVAINLNIEVKLDDNTPPDRLKCQLDDALTRAYRLTSQINEDSENSYPPVPEEKPLSRHNKSVAENRRISKAIEYINEKMPVLEISTGVHNFEHRLVLQRIYDILLGRQKY